MSIQPSGIDLKDYHLHTLLLKKEEVKITDNLFQSEFCKKVLPYILEKSTDGQEISE